MFVEKQKKRNGTRLTSSGLSCNVASVCARSYDLSVHPQEQGAI